MLRFYFRSVHGQLRVLCAAFRRMNGWGRILSTNDYLFTVIRSHVSLDFIRNSRFMISRFWCKRNALFQTFQAEKIMIPPWKFLSTQHTFTVSVLFWYSCQEIGPTICASNRISSTVTHFDGSLEGTRYCHLFCNTVFKLFEPSLQVQVPRSSSCFAKLTAQHRGWDYVSNTFHMMSRNIFFCWVGD